MVEDLEEMLRALSGIKINGNKNVTLSDLNHMLEEEGIEQLYKDNPVPVMEDLWLKVYKNVNKTIRISSIGELAYVGEVKFPICGICNN